MQRKPVVRSLATTAAWLCLFACGSENADLFSGVVPVPMAEPAPESLDTPPVEPPPVMGGTPAFSETMNEGVTLAPAMQPGEFDVP